MEKKRRRYSPQEKTAILREHLINKVPVSDICDRHGLHPTLFYQWQKVAFEGMPALFESRQDTEASRLRKQNEVLQGKLANKDAVIAQITEEYVAAKKKSWGNLRRTWISPEIRDDMIVFTQGYAELSGLSIVRLVGWIGISRGRFYDWCSRYGQANDHNGAVPRDFWLEDWEKQAIISFYLEHQKDGYRRLTFMMLDRDIVAVSPASTYRVLKEAGLMRKWNGKESKKGTGFVQPIGPHEHWHVDVSYLNISGTFYYFCGLLDGYSRYIVHWEIRQSMTEEDVEIIIQRAREKYPSATPRIISDNGPQFIANEFKKFIKLCGMTHVRTSPFYPQSNGKLERFHKSYKQECVRPKTPLSMDDAKCETEKYINNYNNERLHGAIGYIAPVDKLEGRDQAIFDDRQRKLAAAQDRRKAARSTRPVSGLNELNDLRLLDISSETGECATTK